MQRERVCLESGHQTSVTHETSRGEVAKYVPLSSQGGELKLLPEYLTERDV